MTGGGSWGIYIYMPIHISETFFSLNIKIIKKPEKISTSIDLRKHICFWDFYYFWRHKHFRRTWVNYEYIR